MPFTRVRTEFLKSAACCRYHGRKAVGSGGGDKFTNGPFSFRGLGPYNETL